MGAQNVGRFVPKDSKDEVVKDFHNEQEIDRYENGHMYSGGIGMANGIQFTSEVFGSVEEAGPWLEEHCKKWGPALAVRIDGPRQKGWYYEAICAS